MGIVFKHWNTYSLGLYFNVEINNDEWFQIVHSTDRLQNNSTKEHRGGVLRHLDLALGMATPSSHSKNSPSKICSKGWVARKPFVDR